MAATHWFCTFGTNPSLCLYTRDDASYTLKTFVTPALLDLRWPVDPENIEHVRLHLFVTDQLFDPVPIKRWPFDGPPQSPIDLFRSQLEPAALRDQIPAQRFDTHPHAVLLPSRDPDSIWTVVHRVLGAVRDGDRVVLELTNGIRSITTGFLLAAGLLLAMRPNVEVLAVSYAEQSAGSLPRHELPQHVQRLEGLPAHDDGRVATSPVFDLLPFLRLFDWARAVDALARELDPLPIVRLSESAVGRLAKRVYGKGMPESARAMVQQARDQFNRLKQIAPAMALGWPIQAGAAAGRSVLVDPAVMAEAMKIAEEPAAAHVFGFAAEQLGALAEHAPLQTDQLDEARLYFDLLMIERYRDVGRFGDAVRLAREWFVNAALLARGESAVWLDVAARDRVARGLFELANAKDEDARTLGQLWRSVAQARNAASHARYNATHTIGAKKIAEIAKDTPGALRERWGVTDRCERLPMR